MDIRQQNEDKTVQERIAEEDLVKELDHLERVVASKIAELKEKIEKLS